MSETKYICIYWSLSHIFRFILSYAINALYTFGPKHLIYHARGTSKPTFRFIKYNLLLCVFELSNLYQFDNRALFIIFVE